MTTKRPRKGKQCRFVQRKSKCLTPQRKMVLWCLVGIVVGGLSLLVANVNPAPPKQVRRPAVKKVKPALVSLKPAPSKPASEAIAEEKISPAPSPEPQTDEEPTELASTDYGDYESSPDIPDNDIPVAPTPDNTSTDTTDESPVTRGKDRLTATNENGDQYIDMATGTLLFTEDSSLNDENLEIYLENVMDTYKSKEYDQQGAERTNENKQVR